MISVLKLGVHCYFVLVFISNDYNNFGEYNFPKNQSVYRTRTILINYKSSYLDILVLYETKLDDSINFGSFTVKSYLPLIQKKSFTHMHGLENYLKEGLFCKRKSLLQINYSTKHRIYL